VRERFYDYLDGVLDTELLLEVQGHLEQCERCSSSLEARRNILELTTGDQVYQ
jgi:anti-sigma factor RsiW